MKVKWTKVAFSDLVKIFEYISNEDMPETARKIVGIINSSIGQLLKFPESGKKGRVEETRELVVPGTPFTIVYRIKNDALEILTILHHSKKW